MTRPRGIPEVKQQRVAGDGRRGVQAVAGEEPRAVGGDVLADCTQGEIHESGVHTGGAVRGYEASRGAPSSLRTGGGGARSLWRSIAGCRRRGGHGGGPCRGRLRRAGWGLRIAAGDAGARTAGGRGVVEGWPKSSLRRFLHWSAACGARRRPPRPRSCGPGGPSRLPAPCRRRRG